MMTLCHFGGYEYTYEGSHYMSDIYYKVSSKGQGRDKGIHGLTIILIYLRRYGKQRKVYRLNCSNHDEGNYEPKNQ